ncbi:hypothetical protein PCANC_25402 [Puccinia coronata f. sp. avenae]|uniref:Uncharacterized protein n=1 Tax=Puccinia coronata f. sp. avenae TaxID=200324 RepID=A0A2N5TKW7_9BASI|nr:hypothetical protein PCANC_25402 [Puccinia coronata f. sp. avenae]
MGFNCNTGVDKEDTFPNVQLQNVVSSLRVLTPAELAAFVRGSQLKQIGEVNLNSKDVIAAGSYVLFKSSLSVQLGRADHLWETQQGVRIHLFVCLTLFDKGEVDAFYGMRCIQQTGIKHFVKVLDVCAVINVQHNCHSGNCTMQWTSTVHFERRDNGSKAAEFKHGDNDNYIVNGAALLSVGWQRQFSAVPCVQQSNQGQLRALHQGIARWHAQETPSEPSGAFEAVDPTLA